MLQVFDWSAKRSGAAMTVLGLAPDGSAVRLSNIVEIRVAEGGALGIATDLEGRAYSLRQGARPGFIPDAGEGAGA